MTGWPVTHSRSPMIHGYWLRTLGLKGVYEKFPVEPDEAVSFFSSLKSEQPEWTGGNVTIPHKEAAFKACDTLTGEAQRLGAVNTLWVKDGQLHGANTDGAGFLANLDQRAPGWDRKTGKAVVLGAGGAARAIVLALVTRGMVDLTIINRTRDNAERLVDDLNIEADIAGVHDLSKVLKGACLLINTTSLGMTGEPPLEIDLAPMKSGAVVTDIVYAPLETGLLAQAWAKGLTPVDGLGMLLHQAVPGFEIWFGQRPDVTSELRALIEADLERV